MKESTNGAFLSDLVYPGLGQLVLGSFFAGLFPPATLTYWAESWIDRSVEIAAKPSKP